jgi:phosphoglycerate dehydrogenase-like enzyme
MRVVALRRRASLSQEDKDAGVLEEVFSNDQKVEMIRQCDYVVMATPLTEATHQLFDAECVGAMKATAVFVNIGRGKCVDEEALVAALQAGAFVRRCMPGHMQPVCALISRAELLGDNNYACHSLSLCA